MDAARAISRDRFSEDTKAREARGRALLLSRMGAANKVRRDVAAMGQR